MWTDPPGSMDAEGALVNNLDLQLFFAGDMLWPLSGDDLDGYFPFNGDVLNNVERVIWSKPNVGRYWINVKPVRVQVAQPAGWVTGQVTEVAGRRRKPRASRRRRRRGGGAAAAPAEGPHPRRRHHRSRRLHRLPLRLPRLPRCQLQRKLERMSKCTPRISSAVSASSRPPAAREGRRLAIRRRIRACADSFTGIAPGVMSFASAGVKPGTGHVVTALATVAKVIDGRIRNLASRKSWGYRQPSTSRRRILSRRWTPAGTGPRSSSSPRAVDEPGVDADVLAREGLRRRVHGGESRRPSARG